MVFMQFGCKSDVFTVPVYVRWSICLRNQSFSFLSIRVLLGMEPKQHTGLHSCQQASLEFTTVKLLQEVMVFICQRDHTACLSIPRSSADWFASVLLRSGRISGCIDWDKQIHFNLLLKILIQVHHLNSTEEECHLVISAKLDIHFSSEVFKHFYGKFERWKCRLFTPLVLYWGCPLWP